MANKKDPNLNLTNSNMNDTVAAIGPKIDSSIYWYMNCLEKAEIIINYSHQPSNTFELNKLQVNTKKQTMDWDFKIDLIQPDNKGLVSLRTRGSNKYFISDGLYRINRNEKET
ncbi:hypothetical protein FACS1894166_11720 [Bacilli bacterium]|nr:hypothetical protein FACS1894166_11720 [Bacilli bacterium]